MAIEEPGVLWRDGVYFYTASNFAKQHLFYPMWGATYELDSPYRVRRDYMNAYMIQYVVSGELHFKLRGHHFVAKAGELVLLGCKEKNDYWSEGPSRVKWFHFNGKEVGPLLERVYEVNGSGHMSTFFGTRVEPLIDDILKGLKSGNCSEFQFSRDIYSLLCLLAEQTLELEKETPAEESVRRAVDYIRRHYAEALSVQDIASSVSLSPYYFTRLFKRIMLTSPHLYLLSYRLAEAKRMLVYTRDKIDTIASATGFQSRSYVVRAFHREMNRTPNEFRQYFSAAGTHNRYKFEHAQSAASKESDKFGLHKSKK